LTVGILNEGTSIIPLDEFPRTRSTIFKVEMKNEIPKSKKFYNMKLENE